MERRTGSEDFSAAPESGGGDIRFFLRSVGEALLSVGDVTKFEPDLRTTDGEDGVLLENFGDDIVRFVIDGEDDASGDTVPRESTVMYEKLTVIELSSPIVFHAKKIICMCKPAFTMLS